MYTRPRDPRAFGRERDFALGSLARANRPPVSGNRGPGLPLIHSAATPRLCPHSMSGGCSTPRYSTGRQLKRPWPLLGQGQGISALIRVPRVRGLSM
jgi:hypothetical protein